jgi:hypothetical protein
VKTSDVVLLVIGTLVAVTTLVRMMLARRDQLVAEVKRQVEETRQAPLRRRDDKPAPTKAA